MYKDVEVTPYPEYIKGLLRAGKFEIAASREHTKEYLSFYNKGTARPPVHYYRKVAKKDKVEDILSGKELEQFKKLTE